ncbi:hypothetical protein H6G00_01105 [Leptolyngbya sp. FACHB-541]|uniref:hypothetical protein n=1 Tax=Leptolyngbya sp. FACHB-541 TaxID=2692810 RepID=UPI0016874764|nr:hypothetical protein [Leptolyngbya sp. FACHB-541]MBD1995227.1 hypothetical protein [Leptolyngbya sp. FACHB-541]
MTTVLLIHGINNQGNSKDNIEKTWSYALRSSAATAGLTIPDDVKFIAAFYGDVLFNETESWNKNKPTSSPMSVESPDEDYADDEVAALYLEFQQKYGIGDEQVSRELEAEDNLQAQKRMAKGIHKRWLKAIAKALETVLPSKGKRVAAAFISQAAAYLHKPGLKEKVDDLVMTQVIDGLPKDEKVVIISHSLGTIVAYDLMRRLRHQVKVGLLLTAGSPLGIEIVKRRLGTPLICLPNVDKWVNISDDEDFVAFQTKLTSTTFGCDKIVNIDQLDNGDEDAHDILKYLAHDIVAKEIVLNL